MEKTKIKLIGKAKKENKTLNDVLKKAGIVTPHPSNGFFHFIYAPLEDANLNDVRLSTKAVEETLDELKSCQANIEHDRLGGCGSIIDAWITPNDEIEIVVSFFKNLYPKEYKEAMELYDKNELYVSFELCTDPETVEAMADGTQKVHTIYWEGVGILLNHAPAYPGARVLNTAMKIINEAFNQKDKTLIYASITDISKKWTKIGELIEKTIKENQIGGDTMGLEPKVKADLLAKQKQFVIEEFGEEAVKEWTDEDYLNQDKIDAMKVQIAEEKATLDAETAQKEKDKIEAEKTKKDAEILKRKSTETCVYEVTEDTDAGTMEVTATTTYQREEDGKMVEDTKEVRNTLYTFAKLEADVNKAKEEVKAEYEVKIKEKDDLVASKDAEIKTLTDTANIKSKEEKDTKVAKIRAELGDFVKELSDEDLFNEDKIEIAKLKKSNKELRDEGPLTASQREELNASVQEDSEEVKKENQKLYAKKATGQM